MRVTIPEPCSENWEQMSLTSDAARFCASCQKCVVDFSMMSDREVSQRLKSSDVKVCGRFTSAQLDRVLVAQTYKSRNYWSAFLSVALTSVVGLNNSVQEKMGLKPNMEISLNENRFFSENMIENFGRDSVVIIRGKVIDSERLEPVSRAKIYFKNAKTHTYTQADGTFEIKVRTKYLRKNVVFIVSDSNLTPTEFSYLIEDFSKPIVLKIDLLEHLILGRIAIL